jgi:hypothetical protein
LLDTPKPPLRTIFLQSPLFETSLQYADAWDQ